MHHCHANPRIQIVDQYLSFVAPLPSLFSLLPPPSIASNPPPAGSAAPSPPSEPSTYTLLNSPSSTEQQIEEEIERIANGLFSAVATLGTLIVLGHIVYSNPFS